MIQEPEPTQAFEVGKDEPIRFEPKALEQIEAMPLSEKRAFSEGITQLYADVLELLVKLNDIEGASLNRRQKEILRLMCNPKTCIEVRGHAVHIEVIAGSQYFWRVTSVGVRGSAVGCKKIRVAIRSPWATGAGANAQ